MTSAILVNFHKYCPYGDEYFEPLLDFFLNSMRKYADEYDMLYLLDSNWSIDPQKLEGMKAKIVRTDPNVRYYDCFKEVLPQVEEDLVMLLDDDSVIYRAGTIGGVFDQLIQAPEYPSCVVSIFDTIGTYTTDKMGGKNKLCPYLFYINKDLLVKYRDVYWGSNLPEHETLGKLTEVMLDDGVVPYEFPEDKSNILFDGTQDGEHSKNTSFYHVRAGSTVAYLLAEKNYGSDKTYWDYLNNQPTQELLRHCAWYGYMGGNPDEILLDLSIDPTEWTEYMRRFESYHGLNS